MLYLVFPDYLVLCSDASQLIIQGKRNLFPEFTTAVVNKGSEKKNWSPVTINLNINRLTICQIFTCILPEDFTGLRYMTINSGWKISWNENVHQTSQDFSIDSVLN